MIYFNTYIYNRLIYNILKCIKGVLKCIKTEKFNTPNCMNLIHLNTVLIQANRLKTNNLQISVLNVLKI